MAEYRVRIDWSCIGSEHATVEIPDGATQADIDAALDALHDDLDLPDGADWGVEWLDESPAPTWEPPGDGDWFEWRGRRWATDGYHARRDDAPPMEHNAGKCARRWRHPSGGDFDLLMESANPGAPLHRGGFLAAYLPLLTAGKVRGTGPLEPAFVWRDGECIAVVMPWPVAGGGRNPGVVNARGEPWEVSP